MTRMRPLDGPVARLALGSAALLFAATACAPLDPDTLGGGDLTPGDGEGASDGSDGTESPDDGATGVPGDGADPGADGATGDGTGGATELHGVHLRTVLGGQYLGDAGDGTVTATATSAGDAESFTLTDDNGGALESGDLVTVRGARGGYFEAADGGGGALALASDHAEWRSFRLVRKAGDGTVANGDIVGLAAASGRWVAAENGGGGAVYAYGESMRAWEELTISGLAGDDVPTPPSPTMRVVGYLPNWYGSFGDWAGRVDFGKLTHVNLAFALGDDGGNLQLAPEGEIDAFVSAAHARGVKVFPSLCGGGGDGRIAPFYEPDRVDAFVDGIIDFALARNFDGIDVDVEAPQRMGQNYDTFIAELKEAAGAHGLEVTAAVAQWMQSGMSDDTLRSFDFITIMSYDNSGTWTGPGEHASYAQAQEALQFYLDRGVDPAKLVLGVPFYGYCWGNCDGEGTKYMLYKDILARYADAAHSDWIDRDGAQYSLNSVETIAQKTALAAQYGGIMLWELGGDVATSEETSLLRAIAEAMP